MKRMPVLLLSLALGISVPSIHAQNKVPYNQMPVRYYLSGKVTYSSNSRPARSVWIYLFDGRVRRSRTLTGDDGRFYIGKLERKTYTVVVKQRHKRDYRFGNVTLPKHQDIEIVLP